MRPLGFLFLAFLVLAGGVLCAATPLRADESSGADDDTSTSSIEDLFLGEYWFGAPIEDRDLEGKVVLFEIWGS